MITYYFYAKADTLKEKIAKQNANSLEEAIKTFSIIKGLPENEFKKLYAVAEWTATQQKPF